MPTVYLYYLGQRFTNVLPIEISGPQALKSPYDCGLQSLEAPPTNRVLNTLIILSDSLVPRACHLNR